MTIEKRHYGPLMSVLEGVGERAEESKEDRLWRLYHGGAEIEDLNIGLDTCPNCGEWCVGRPIRMKLGTFSRTYLRECEKCGKTWEDTVNE